MTVMKALYAEYGVTVISRDVVTDSIDFPPRSLDVVTIFDSLEHWHHSPKKVLRAVMETLKPNGYLITGTPNCVNLRKRITVPLGIGKWSALEEWYEKDVFRSHVREPDVEDLRYIARDIGLSDVQIEGRNWIGYSSRWKIVQTLVPFADRLLRLRPSLCSNLYMIGRNPAAAT
jgi:SAM-dependent methyltransferase